MAHTSSIPMISGHTSAWSPCRLPLFRILWIATPASSIGTWIHDIGTNIIP